MKSEISLQQNVSLQSANSFGIDACAHRFLRVESIHQLQALRQQLQADASLAALPRFVLGGGSNVILSDHLPHLVLQMAIMGRELFSETPDHYVVRAGAGENWHAFVQWTLAQGYPGLENLSLIPGTVGASPIQNIGAYGLEMQDYFHRLSAFDLLTGEIKIFQKQDCAFAYRDSIFKSGEQYRFVIVDVSFVLPKQWQARLGYGDVAKYLQERGIASPNANDVSAAIVAIRQSKLPDPAVIGNAGSFFKNPIVTASQRDQILKQYPQCVSYQQANGDYKLAAGWLIETAGWKGRQCGTVGVYEKQALVLVNLGRATGAAVRELALAIQHDVLNKFGVQLEIEPVFV